MRDKIEDDESEPDPLLQALKQLADESLSEEIPERLAQILRKPSGTRDPVTSGDDPSGKTANRKDHPERS